MMTGFGLDGMAKDDDEKAYRVVVEDHDNGAVRLLFLVDGEVVAGYILRFLNAEVGGRPTPVDSRWSLVELGGNLWLPITSPTGPAVAIAAVDGPSAGASLGSQ